MFTSKELDQLMAIRNGGYKTVAPRKVRQKDGGYKTVGGGGIDYNFYSGRATTGMPGFNMKQDPVSRNFGRIAEELGLKSVDSVNDISAIYDYLGRNMTRSSKQEAPKQESITPNTTAPTVSQTETVTQEGVPDETYYDDRESTGTTGFDPNNIGRFAGRSDRFGMRDLMTAYNSGYSFGDVNRYLAGLRNNPGWRDRESGGFNSESYSFQALQENRGGQITTKYLDPNFHPDSGQWGGPASKFGNADLLGNRKAGFTDRQIMAFLDANPNTLSSNNKKGVQGGLYETLKAGLPPEPKDPKNLLIGSTSLGNSGSASGVKPKRSANSQSGRSSYGTSQYNRSNFGTIRSPLAIGLNI